MNKPVFNLYPFTTLAAVFALTLAFWNGSLLAAPADEGSSPPPAAAVAPPKLSADQLNDLVAPVALYPDALLSQVLVASTNPLQIIEAQQWVQHHPELKGEALIAAAKQQDWDPSVQALVAFPDALKRLSEDVAWTTNLGVAFSANQSDVMDAVQRMRLRAQESGKLVPTSEENVKTVTENGKNVIVIEPSNPEVVYVPAYDPAWVWGPSAYYPYPYWYYPPPPPFGYCSWSPPCYLGISFGFGFGSWCWSFGWFDRCVFIHHDLIHRGHFRGAHFFPEHGFARFQSGGFNRFNHMPSHSRFTAAQVRGGLTTSAHRFGMQPWTSSRMTRSPSSSGIAPRTTAPRTFSRSFTPRTPSRSFSTPRMSSPRTYSRSFSAPRTSSPRTFSRSFAPPTRSMPRSSSPGFASHYNSGRSFGRMGGGFSGGRSFGGGRMSGGFSGGGHMGGGGGGRGGGFGHR